MTLDDWLIAAITLAALVGVAVRHYRMHRSEERQRQAVQEGVRRMRAARDTP